MIHVRQKHEPRELECHIDTDSADDAALEYAAHYDRRTWSHSVALGMRTLDLIVRVGETELEIRVRGKMVAEYEVVE